jgi:hypothetical protein
MKSSLKVINIKDIETISKTINLNPTYQRDYIAHEKKGWQQKLIGSIFKGNRVIPNLYARVDNQDMVMDGGNRISALHSITEMIDGQQRFRTIMDFLNDKFKLDTCVVVDYQIEDECDLSGMNWSDVKINFPQLAEKFLSSELRLVLTHSHNEAEIMQMFCDLNDLNAMTEAEKRNAINTAPAAYVRGTSRLDNKWKGVKFELHDLFKRDSKSLKSLYTSLTFKKMAQDELLAKITAIVLGIGKESGISAKTLKNMYLKPEYRNQFSSTKVDKVLDKLYTMLKNKKYKKSVNLGVILNLTLITNHILNDKSLRVKHWNKFVDWFFVTHNRLLMVSDKQKKIGIEETAYHQKTRLSSDSKGLEIRLQFLLNELDSCDGVIGVDPLRVISDRDLFNLWLQNDDGKGNKVCEDCGCTLRFGDAVKGHIDAHSAGGATIVENTKVICRDCNVPEVK